jgi:2-polyprenyl-3-methyl-5-hydroxy-6-metoxy-1,4-benzoquinol methylase
MAALSRRRLVGEILDGLAPDDPRAVASRRDLRRINVVMRQHAIVERLLRTHLPSPPRRLLEIGGGDGQFMLGLARRLARDWPGVELTLVDLTDSVTPATRAGFAAAGWALRVVTADIFAWAGDADASFDAVIANLVLHHFDDAQLARLFAAMAPLAPVFLAAEPRRAAFPLFSSLLVGAIGANDVTRHDAPASVRAGFRGGELGALWPGAQDAVLTEGRRGLFTHVFAASRPLS